MMYDEFNPESEQLVYEFTPEQLDEVMDHLGVEDVRVWQLGRTVVVFGMGFNAAMLNPELNVTLVRSGSPSPEPTKVLWMATNFAATDAPMRSVGLETMGEVESFIRGMRFITNIPDDMHLFEEMRAMMKAHLEKP